MNAPITYVPNFVANPVACFEHLWAGMPWEKRPDAPRRECWMNDAMKSYTYGRGAGERTYHAQPWHPMVTAARSKLKLDHGVYFEGCFTNGYDGPRDHLGWHADDSPTIDATRPIAIVSLGSARRIMFREKGGEAESILLEPGSLLLMHAGMQQTHEHRIPKHSADCGPRVSMTFRGLVA